MFEFWTAVFLGTPLSPICHILPHQYEDFLMEAETRGPRTKWVLKPIGDKQGPVQLVEPSKDRDFMKIKRWVWTSNKKVVWIISSNLLIACIKSVFSCTHIHHISNSIWFTSLQTVSHVDLGPGVCRWSTATVRLTILDHCVCSGHFMAPIASTLTQ